MLPRALRPVTRSLPRASALLPQAAVQRRWDSHDSHDSHAHGAASDEVYPEETFFTPFGIKVMGVIVASFGVYYFWPAGNGQEPWLTRFIGSQDRTEQYKETTGIHTVLAMQGAVNKREAGEAKRPSIHRFRYKHTFDQADPDLIAVGSQCDLSDLKIKTHEDFYRL